MSSTSEHFSEQIAALRSLLQDLISCKDQVVAQAAYDKRLMEIVEQARDEIEDILEDPRFELLKLGERGLHAKRDMAVTRADRLLGESAAYREARADRARVVRRLDAIDELQARIDTDGETTVIARLTAELEYRSIEAQITAGHAMAELHRAVSEEPEDRNAEQ